MNEFQKLLLLSYIEEVGANFSYFEFAKRIGTSAKVVEEILDLAIRQKRVRCDDQSVLYAVTAIGKELLNESGVVYYRFKEVYEEGSRPEQIPINRPYVPKDFLRKLV